jgi:hypothetical protein
MRTTGGCLFIILMMIRAVESGCECEDSCRKKGQPYGLCGDGYSCICSSKPIVDAGRVIIIEPFEVKKQVVR